MTDAAALLAAICDRPDDDTPRLVFADWLDDHAASDADRARVELIRLWFSLQPGMRSTTRTLSDWLVRNWRRLWPRVAVAANAHRGVRLGAKGRVLRGQLAWYSNNGIASSDLKVHFDRGSAERVQFGDRAGYEHLWTAFAHDEPIAQHEPLRPPSVALTPPSAWSVGRDGDWGEDVAARVQRLSAAQGGVRTDPSSTSIIGQWFIIAMTARAREANGMVVPPA